MLKYKYLYKKKRTDISIWNTDIFIEMQISLIIK